MHRKMPGVWRSSLNALGSSGSFGSAIDHSDHSDSRVGGYMLVRACFCFFMLDECLLHALGLLVRWVWMLVVVLLM